MCVDVVDSNVVVGMKEVVVVGRSVVCPLTRAKTVKKSFIFRLFFVFSFLNLVLHNFGPSNL